MSYQLGIIGGVGSEASAYLYDKILKRTKVTKDQDHLNMIVLNHASIADRTAYILDHNKSNPLPSFLDDIHLLNNLHVELILIPCNTSHYFYDAFTKESEAPIYHLIDQTILSLKQENVTSVGILATDGTIQSQLYQKACEKQGIQWCIPNKENQQNVMDIIYHNLKAGTIVDRTKFANIDKEMRDQKVERVILACTELSMLKEREQLSSYYVDPLDIATNYVLRKFKKTIK